VRDDCVLMIKIEKKSRSNRHDQKSIKSQTALRENKSDLKCLNSYYFDLMNRQVLHIVLNTKKNRNIYIYINDLEMF
jgi:cytidylate kinase